MAEQTQIRLADGRSLDVWEAGAASGPVLLYHHGTPSSGLPDPALSDALSRRGMHYASFSRAGYGSSSRRPGRSIADVVDDARAVLDAMGAATAHVLGWSGGGPHALACAALMPQRVRGTALIGGVAPYPAEGLDWFDGMGAENIEEFQAAIAGPQTLIGYKERAWQSFRDIAPEEVAEGLGDLVDEVDRGSIKGEFVGWMAASWHEALRESYWGWFDDDLAFAKPWGFDVARIPGPVHIWQGDHDRMVPFAHGAWLSANVGGACAHLHQGHGHLTLAVDSLDLILDELLDAG